MADLEQFFTDFITAISGSAWLHPGLFVLVLIDGVLPFLPVETALVILLSWAHSTGQPSLISITATAGLAAVAGDSLAFCIGRRARKLKVRPHAKLNRLQHQVADQINHRAAFILLTARFVPVGRVVATMSAGASGLPYRRFVPLSCLASGLWAGWITVIGAAGSAVLGDRPALAAIAAATLALLVGAVVDRLSSRRNGVGGESVSPDSR